MALASAPRWTFALAPRGSNAWRSNRAAERVRNFSTGACARTGCASVGGSLGNSHSGLVWGFSGLSSLFFPQVRSLTSSRMAKSKASKRSLRSKDLEILKCHRCFEGTVFRCTHRSAALGLDACFSVYVPDAPRIHTTLPYPRDCEEFPVLLFLSDEGCNDIDILMQGNVLQHCSDCGLILVSADTCPREAETEGAEGVSVCGASYYVNATEKPWNTHCKMRDYLEAELLDLVHDNFPTCGSEAVSIMGHGMGGTAALSMALRKDALPFRSVSALAPLLNPTEVEVTKTLRYAKAKALQVLQSFTLFSVVVGKCWQHIPKIISKLNGGTGATCQSSSGTSSCSRTWSGRIMQLNLSLMKCFTQSSEIL